MVDAVGQHRWPNHCPPARKRRSDDGHHREALGWTTPFYCASTDVLLADGADAEVALAATRRDGFLCALGFGDPALLGGQFGAARRVFDEIFALADRLVAEHPAIAD